MAPTDDLPHSGEFSSERAPRLRVHHAPPREEEIPADDAIPLRRHPFAGIGPLMTPLELGGPPIGYDRTHLALLVQSPDTVLCYWSLRERDPDLFGADPVELRLFEVAEGAERLARRERVDPNVGRWFVRGLTPDRRYRAVLGVARGHDFLPRLSSATASTPPSGPSGLRETIFVTVALPPAPATSSASAEPTAAPRAGLTILPISPAEASMGGEVASREAGSVAQQAWQVGLRVSPATRWISPAARAPESARLWAARVPLHRDAPPAPAALSPDWARWWQQDAPAMEAWSEQTEPNPSSHDWGTDPTLAPSAP